MLSYEEFEPELLPHQSRCHAMAHYKRKLESFPRILFGYTMALDLTMTLNKSPSVCFDQRNHFPIDFEYRIENVPHVEKICAVFMQPQAGNIHSQIALKS